MNVDLNKWFTSSKARLDDFVQEIKKSGTVWVVKGPGSYPTARSSKGVFFIPFWSSETEAKKVLASADTYQEDPLRESLVVEAISVENWVQQWLDKMGKNSRPICINWSGNPRSGTYVAGKEIREKLK
jgi:hypothetical protein